MTPEQEAGPSGATTRQQVLGPIRCQQCGAAVRWERVQPPGQPPVLRLVNHRSGTPHICAGQR